jgi:hypothetical protein
VGADGQSHKIVANRELFGVAGRRLQLGGFLKEDKKNSIMDGLN